MNDDNLCDRVVEYILIRQDKDLSTLNDVKIARRFGVKRSYLSQKFEAEHKLTLKEFILRERLYRAFFMIERGHIMSSLELSKKLGFPQPRRFVREFKNLFLVDPHTCIDLERKRNNL